MTLRMLGLLSETPVHAGTGRSVGVVDLPIAREAATDYPVVVGSSMKGALRNKAEGLVDKSWVDQAFGTPESGAGAGLVSEARLLLLPVRCLTGAYRWVTCPHQVERFVRDMARAGVQVDEAKDDADDDDLDPRRHEVLCRGETGSRLYLEEREFQIAGDVPGWLETAISKLILHASTRKRLAEQIAVVHNDALSWFVRYGLPIQARNVLDDDKRSQNLWFEETLPPDTVMYALVGDRGTAGDGSLDIFGKVFPTGNPYLQVGGNETVGQGWFAVRPVNGARE